MYTDKHAFQGGAVLDHRLVEQCVESLCLKGCRAVWSDIDALEAGDALPATAGLSRQEVRAVIAELRAVMAVYQGSCGADRDPPQDQRDSPRRRLREILPAVEARKRSSAASL